MFERLTETSRQVIVFSQDEARALRHDHIGTEHILLGLLRAEDGLASRVLESFDVTVEEARFQVARIVGEGDSGSAGQIPFTPRATKVLELALVEARSLDRNQIESEHLLLALVRENQGVGARLLGDFGIDPRDVADAVLAALGEPGPPGYAEGFPPAGEQEALDDQIAVASAFPLELPAPAGGRRPLALLVTGWLLFAAALAVGLLLGRLIWG